MQVQVQSVAQLGVQLLLFSLGLEFSLAKLQVHFLVSLPPGAAVGQFGIYAGSCWPGPAPCQGLPCRG